MRTVADLNEEIRKLNAEGKSLRQIASATGISHTTVMRRVRGMEQVSLPGIVTKNVTERARLKPHPSRVPGASPGSYAQQADDSVLCAEAVKRSNRSHRANDVGRKVGPATIDIHGGIEEDYP